MKRINGRELKKEILKANPNLKSKDINVRYDGSYDINVNIAYPLSLIEKIADQYKRVSRCEYSGEILSGGNTFVNVSYNWRGIEINEELKELIGSLKHKLEYGVKIYHNSIALKKDIEALTKLQWSEDDCNYILSNQKYLLVK